MPLRLEIKKLLASRSERVKACDLHPDEPWVLAALYTGHLFIWNYNTQTVVKTFEVCDQPLRCAKFIARKQWIICGADDMKIRVYNYNTLDKVAQFEGHLDYIRYLEVHPTQPYVLSTSDDMSIKLWNWEKDWANTQVFEGHAHYVMMARFNPKDTNTFASASLDKSIKVWSLGSPLPNYSLEGHDKGVNAIDYYAGGDKPYLISGADDFLVKIWDYQTKACVQTLDGHTNHVTAVCFHPKLPVLLTGGEDGTVRMWHSNTYRLETTLNYGLERVWSIAVSPHTNKIAIGYDEGTIVLTLGKEMPSVSVDSSGKALMTKNNEVVSFSLRGVSTLGLEDGERVEYQTKDLGSCEIFPQKILHNNNGRFVVVCGDGEYIIYTSQALRNKAFGSGLDFGWSSFGTGDYAVRESSSRVRTFKNFKEMEILSLPFTAESLYGGSLIGVCGSEFVVFYDWEQCRLVMKIDVAPLDIIWSSDGELVTLVCEDSYFVLQCNLDVIAEAFSNGTASAEDGIEDAFALLHEIGEQVTSGQWVGSCFLYTNKSNRVNYYVGGEVITLCHLDRSMNLMGFVPKENRLFLVDKNRTVTSYEILETVLQYQTAVVRKDFDSANQLLATIPRQKYNDISRFLESQGYKEVALQVADDPDQKMELAIQLEKLDVALDIMNNEIVPKNEPDDLDVLSRWKQLGDLALSKGNLALAEQCATSASDLNGLLLMHSSYGNIAGIKDLIVTAESQGRTNISFLCSLLVGDTNKCVEILQKTKRFAEAALFARTFAPKLVDSAVKSWKEDLATVNKRASDALAAPADYPELFPSLDDAIAVDQIIKDVRGIAPGSAYLTCAPNIETILVDLYKEQGEDAIKALFQPFSMKGEPKVASGNGPKDAQVRLQQEEQQRIQQQQEEQQRIQQLQEEQMRIQQQQEEQVRIQQQQEEQVRIQQQQEEQMRIQQQQEEQFRVQQQQEEQMRLQQQQEEQVRVQQQQEEQMRLQQQHDEQIELQQSELLEKQSQQLDQVDVVDDDELGSDLEKELALGDDDNFGSDEDIPFDEDWS